MRQIHRLLLAAALIALPAVAEAQQNPPANRGGRMMQGQMSERMQQRSPVQFFLDHKAELRLTPEQVTRLEAIGAELQARNQPLREQMMAARGERSGERPTREEMAQRRQEMAERRKAMAPLMEEMQKNNATAREEIQALLNPEQQKVAKDLLQAQRQERRPDRDRIRRQRQDRQQGQRPGQQQDPAQDPAQGQIQGQIQGR